MASCEITFSCVRGFDSLFYSQSAFGRSSYSAGNQACAFANAKNAEEIASSIGNMTNQAAVSKIVFGDSQFSEFPENTFSKLENLKQLSASRVGMKTLTSTFLAKHATFDAVDLSDNKITRIEGGTFANLIINDVDLSSNEISSIDSKAFNNSRVQKLNLENNLIKDIQFLENFGFFKTLDLSKNLFVEIKSIDVNKNTWSAFTKTSDIMLLLMTSTESTILMNENKNLKTFNCKSIISFSLISLDDNPNLTDVKLNDCSVTSLHLSGSSSDKQKNIQLNDKIETFVAKNSKLTNVDFRTTKSLKSLIVSNNSLSPETINQTLQIVSLQELDLSYNFIGPLNISTFAKLKNLKTLKLKATNISNIQFGTFSHQDKVESLNIADNQLGVFDLNMIYSLSSLLQLDISGNNLQELTNHKHAHQQFTLLRIVDVTHNNFTCSYLMNLVKIFRTYQISMQKSKIEEQGWNIQGIRCNHVAGDGLDPLPSADGNSTSGYLASDVVEKVNSISEVLRKLSSRLDKIEESSNKKPSPSAEKLVNSSSFEVRNSKLMETALIVVCICFTVFMGLKIFMFVKRNFIDSGMKRSRGMSEHTLTMVDDY